MVRDSAPGGKHPPKEEIAFSSIPPLPAQKENGPTLISDETAFFHAPLTNPLFQPAGRTGNGDSIRSKVFEEDRGEGETWGCSPLL